MKLLDILNRDNWIQGRDFEDADGREVYSHAEACRFCLKGALKKLYKVHVLEGPAVEKLGFLTIMGLIVWNDSDSRTWEQVEHRIKESGL